MRTARWTDGTLAISVLVGALVPFALGQAIFTEYVEGTGHNKALEISNLGDVSFDLSACQIKMYFNGAAHPGQTFNLDGILAPGEAHVFVHREAGGNYSESFEAAVAAAPSSQSAGFGWFNGNDAIVLVCDSEVADSLGQVGDDAYWGKDVTLRRSEGPPKTDPRSSWDPDALGWVEYRQNTFDGLGKP
jgi:uncharacterized protein